MAGDGKMGASMGVSGYAGRLEVVDGPTGRRRRSDAEKARIAVESLAPDMRVADVARRHGTTRWQVHDWRRRLKDGRLAVPAEVAEMPVFAALVVEEAPSEPAAGSAAEVIEIVVDGMVVRAGAGASEAHLARVLRAVRAAG